MALLMMAALPSTMQAQRMQQPLGRAVVAVASDNSNVFVSWRKLAQEDEDCTYNLYRRVKGTTTYTRVNSEPIDKTNFQTTLTQIPYDSELAVTTVSGNVESDKSNPFVFRKQAYKDLFFDFDFDNKVLLSDNYRTKYAWPMDLDGNGEIDAMLVDRLYSGKKGDDPATTTTSHKLQAYKLTGELLWTIDMGPNVKICAGQNDLVVAYDINCDGKTEVIIKSSDLTRFWDAKAGTWGKYANGSTVADTDGDGIIDYTAQTKRNPPFYISVVDAKTGEEISCSELKYDQIKDSKDTYSRDNRANYMNDDGGTEYAFLGGKFAIAYFDGTHPSLAVQCYNRSKTTGHHYYVLEWKYDWNNGRPTNWHHDSTWSMNDAINTDGEFHQLRVGDVNGDGVDEVMEGGYIMNPRDGLVTDPKIHHGDRFDLGDIDPERPGLEMFAIQQANLLGQVLYDAATGEHIKEWYLPTVYDVGRGHAMDVDPKHKGYEMFSFIDNNLYDCKGDVVQEGGRPYPFEGTWWDGNLQREFIGSPGGSGYSTNVNITTYSGNRLLEISKGSDWLVHASSGARPAFMGDIVGDWREEVVLMKQTADKSVGLVGYTTNLPTDYSMYTLQQDPHYRLDCTTRGYYQAPNTSFYLGEDMPYPPLPPCMVTDLRWSKGSAWMGGGAGFTTFDQTAATNYSDGKSVIFDMSGDNAQTISLSGSLKPQCVYVMNPKGHDFVFGGEGSLEGDMQLWKSRQGKATFNNNLKYTGKTVISEGTLVVNGTIEGPIDLRAKGTLSGDATVKGDITFEGGLNYEGCRLIPGSETDKFGVMTFTKSLTIPGNVYIELNAAESHSGKIKVNGDLTFQATNTITIDAVDGDIEAGKYVVAECTGKLSIDDARFNFRGLDGKKYKLAVEDKQLVVYVDVTRAPQKDVAWTGDETNVWDYKANNFNAGGETSYFVANDEVVFDDRSANRNVTVDDIVIANSVTFDNNEGKYSFTGEGGIGGTSTVIKNGKGEVDINLRNSNYTGATIINEGTLTVHTLADGGKASDLGAASAEEGNLQLNGGTLKVDAINMATDRLLTVSDTSTIDVVNSKGSVSLKSIVKGNGYLVKTGAGQLNFNYSGENPFAGLIVKAGKVSQGAWNSSFGKVGGPMVLAGGTVDLIDVNSSANRPVFNYVTTVVEGTSSTVMGTERGYINGSFKGKGNLTIVSTGVRNDIGADFSEFEGELTAKGSNFRLMSGVTDMSKTDLVIDETGNVGHFVSGTPTAEEVTTKLGSLSASAKTANIGSGKDTYEIGYNNRDARFSGTLKAKTIKKYGMGSWTVNSEGSSSSVDVVEGTLVLNNSPLSYNAAAFTTGSVTVRDSAVITGVGTAGSVTVYKGGTIVPGGLTTFGTFKTTGNLIMRQGSMMKFKVGVNASGVDTNDKLKVGGRLTHSNDTVLISVSPERTLNVGDQIQLFYGDILQSGTYLLKTEAGGLNIAWDESKFLSDGILTVESVTGIAHTPVADDTLVDVYTVDGVRLLDNVTYHKAMTILKRGVYIVNGQKVVKD